MRVLKQSSMEKAMATHSSTLAWKIPWMEEPGVLQSMGSLRVGHDWATSLYFSLSCIGEGNGNPLQYSCLENLRDGGAWWAAVYGVAQSRTRLKRLSSFFWTIRVDDWETGRAAKLKNPYHIINVTALGKFSKGTKKWIDLHSHVGSGSKPEWWHTLKNEIEDSRRLRRR